MTVILCLIFQIFIMKSTASQLAGYEKVETATLYFFVLLHAVSKYVSNQEVVQLIEVPPI